MARFTWYKSPLTATSFVCRDAGDPRAANSTLRDTKVTRYRKVKRETTRLVWAAIKLRVWRLALCYAFFLVAAAASSGSSSGLCTVPNLYFGWLVLAAWPAAAGFYGDVPRQQDAATAGRAMADHYIGLSARVPGGERRECFFSTRPP